MIKRSGFLCKFFALLLALTFLLGQPVSAVAGSSGAVPDGVATPATSATEAMVAGSTVTWTVTGPLQPSTVPETSKEPPSRAV